MQEYIYAHSIGKTADSLFNETEDCVVRCYANLLDISYAEAHALFRAAGRKDRQQTYIHTFMPLYEKAGIKLRAAFGTTDVAKYLVSSYNARQRPGITLKRCLPILRKGKYAILTRQHIFALVDGKILDAGALKANTRVCGIFEIQTEGTYE